MTTQNNFIEVNPLDFNENVFKLINKDWLLLTAEKEGKINTMTVAWGGLGVMWEKKVAFIAVRPERYTYEFLKTSDNFSLTAFDISHKKSLAYCGSTSGRDQDKIAHCGFTTLYDGNIPYFAEARLSINCRQIMHTELSEKDFDKNKTVSETFYSEQNKNTSIGGGYHILFIAEIEKILIKK